MKKKRKKVEGEKGQGKCREEDMQREMTQKTFLFFSKKSRINLQPLWA